MNWLIVNNMLGKSKIYAWYANNSLTMEAILYAGPQQAGEWMFPECG